VPCLPPRPADAHQVGNGDLSEYDVHLDGIHQMLALRGGVQNIRMRGIVSNWLSVCFGPWHPAWTEEAPRPAAAAAARIESSP
jgi:hypothetical protein